MRNAFFKFLLLFLLFVTACTDTDEVCFRSNTERNLEEAPSLIKEARKIISEPVSRVSLYGNENTNNTVEIKWEEYIILDNEEQEAAVVPISGDTKPAYVCLTEEGRSKESLNKVVSKLIVRRNPDSGEITAIVGTYVCDKSYYHKNYDELETLGYDFCGTAFTGYFIASRLDGTMLSGRRIVKGVEQFRFYPNPLPPEEREHSTDCEKHIFINLHPVSVTRATLSSLSTSMGENTDDVRCSLCGKSADECDCLIIEYCQYCGLSTSLCTCDTVCDECGSVIVSGECLCCDFCNKFPCECFSTGDSGGGTGDTGSGSSGGSSSSGSSGSSGSGSGTGSSGTTTTPTYITTAANLTNAAKNAVQSMSSTYGTEIAVCNFGVQAAFKNIFGSDNLPPGMSGRANDMVTAWAANPDYWQPITLEEAQNYANNGYFVVAGWYNKTGASGHVVVVVPGETEWSNSWKCNVPMTMDTGEGKREYKQLLSIWFASNKKDDTKYYYYKGE